MSLNYLGIASSQEENTVVPIGILPAPSLSTGDYFLNILTLIGVSKSLKNIFEGELDSGLDEGIGRSIRNCSRFLIQWP